MSTKSTFAERLQATRRAAGYRSAKDFADAFGESFGTIISWESRGIKPSADMLVKICRFLSVSADYLLGLTDTAANTTITQQATNSPNATQTAGNCAACPFAESYRQMAQTLAEIALRSAK